MLANYLANKWKVKTFLLIILFILLFIISKVFSQPMKEFSILVEDQTWNKKSEFILGKDWIFVKVEGPVNEMFTLEIYRDSDLIARKYGMTDKLGNSVIPLDFINSAGSYLIILKPENSKFRVTTSSIKVLREESNSIEVLNKSKAKENVFSTKNVTNENQKIIQKLEPLELSGKLRQTVLGNDFNISTYGTRIKIISRHVSPVSQRISFAVFNDKLKNFSYVAIATYGRLKYFKAWHLIHKTKIRRIINQTVLLGNRTDEFEDSLYIPPHLDPDTNQTEGNYTIVYSYYNVSYNYTGKEYDQPILLNESKEFLREWNGEGFNSIKNELENYHVEINLSLLDPSVLPDNDQLVYIYKVPHKQNLWEYFEYSTDNVPNKFLVFDPAGGSWWNESWSYNRKIIIQENSGNNLEEYQVNLTVDTKSLISQGKMNSDCSDIRFVWYNESSQQYEDLSYYLEENECNTSSTRIWIKVPYIQANDNVTIYMYYGNPSAESESSLEETFSYSKPRIIGYVVSDQIVSNGLKILSLCDDNQVQVGSNTYNLNEMESVTITSGLTISTSIKSKCLAQIEGAGDVDDIIIPVSWAGKEFIHGGMRATDEFCMLAPFGDASVTIYDGGSSVWSGTVTSSGTCITQNITSGNAARIESDKPILVFHGGNEDAFAMYPATKETLYGPSISNDAYIAAGSNGAIVDCVASNGGTTQLSISADSQVNCNSLGSGNSGSGPAVRVNGSNPIGAIQQADHDGSESTVFVPKIEMTTKFGSGLGAEYIAIATPYADTSCTVYDSSGNIIETKSATGSNGIYQICFGCGNDNTYANGGWKVECTKPVWGYYEEDSNGDETNLLGWKQMRQYVYPEPTISIENEQQPNGSFIASKWSTSFKGYLLMEVQKLVDNEWQTVSVRVNDSSTGTLRNITAFSALDVGSIWNSNPWDTDQQEAGTYRVYVALTDVNGNVLKSESGYINGSYNFTITQPPVQLNITEIRIYNVTNNPNTHIYTGDLIGSGINTTFTLYTGETYRAEIAVKNLGSATWYIILLVENGMME